MQFLPGVSEAIALLTVGDYSVFMLSNQRGVLTIHQSAILYRKMHHSACTPSFHVIFLPSSYVRPA